MFRNYSSDGYVEHVQWTFQLRQNMTDTKHNVRQIGKQTVSLTKLELSRSKYTCLLCVIASVNFDHQHLTTGPARGTRPTIYVPKSRDKNWLFFLSYWVSDDNLHVGYPVIIVSARSIVRILIPKSLITCHLRLSLFCRHQSWAWFANEFKDRQEWVIM